jgi:hypothetical protein
MFDFTPPAMAHVEQIVLRRSANVEQVRSAPAKGWTLTVRRDRFTDEKSCIVRSRGVRYRDGVLTFQFGPSVDTANAVYRLDNGAARSVGAVAVESAGRGASFLTSNTSNPSAGLVRLPVSEVQGHQGVAIRPSAKARVRNFSLVGFDVALTAAGAKGCPMRVGAANSRASND